MTRETIGVWDDPFNFLPKLDLVRAELAEKDRRIAELERAKSKGMEWMDKAVIAENKVAELQELNRKAKDVLEQTLDCEASASVARNRLEIKLSELQQMAEKLAGALEDCRDVMRITLTGDSIIFAKINITLAAYKAMKGEK